MTLRIKPFGQASVADSHRSWRPVLKEWASLMDRYVDAHEDDPAPFAYTERANVGLLAGAILRAAEENLCLEEYTACKDTSKGRVDLWAIVDDETYLMEAKFGWTSCQNNIAFFESVKTSTESENVTVRQMLDTALEQAASYSGEQPAFHVAAAFVVPYITPGQTTEFKDIWAELRVEELHLGPHSGFVAYYSQRQHEIDPEAKCLRYPGVVLFISFRRHRG